MKREFKNELVNGKTNLTISGPIGKPDEWFNSDAISAEMIKDALSEAEGDIIVELNSGGGNVFEGIEIYNYLKGINNHVTVKVTALAASAASIIAMAGDEIVMCTGSQMMIHKASSLVIGTSDDMLKEAEVLLGIESSIVDIYEERTELDRGHLVDLLNEETWMNALEAVENGFADKVTEKPVKKAVTASVNVDFSNEFKEILDETRKELAEVKNLMNEFQNAEHQGSIFNEKNKPKGLNKLFGGK